MKELEIKTALLTSLRQQGAGATFLEEVAMDCGQVRADIVGVEELHCYEIKSEYDSLKRLVRQGSRYARVFKMVTLVIAPKHLEKAIVMLPEWWGIIVVSEEYPGLLKQYRPAKFNSRIASDALATVLLRDEALDLLKKHGHAKGMSSKALYELQEFISQTVDLEDLCANVSSYFSQRNNVLSAPQSA